MINFITHNFLKTPLLALNLHTCTCIFSHIYLTDLSTVLKVCQDICTIDENLSKQVNNTANEKQETTLICHIQDMVHTTCKEYFTLLSSISNYHWIENVGLFMNKPSKSQNRYANHMIYFDPEDKGGSKSDKCHIPTSPRMCLMHMLLDDNYESSIHNLIKHFLHLDTTPEEVQLSENPQDCEQPPLKKRRKQTPRIVSVHPSSICKEIGVDYNVILN